MTAYPFHRPVLTVEAMKAAKAKRQAVLNAVRARRGMIYRRCIEQRRAALARPISSVLSSVEQRATG